MSAKIPISCVKLCRATIAIFAAAFAIITVSQIAAAQVPPVEPPKAAQTTQNKVDELLRQFFDSEHGDASSYGGIESATALSSQPFPGYQLLELRLRGVSMLTDGGLLSYPAMGNGFGPFAFDGKQLLPLLGEKGQANLSRILREERTPVEALDPFEFASLLCQTILPESNESCRVLWSDGKTIRFRKIDSASLQLANSKSALGNLYRIEELSGLHLFNELKNPPLQDLPPPVITVRSDGGWAVRFAAASYSMWHLHGAEYSFYNVGISPSYDVSVSKMFIHQSDNYQHKNGLFIDFLSPKDQFLVAHKTLRIVEEPGSGSQTLESTQAIS